MKAAEFRGYALEDTVIAFDLSLSLLEMLRTICQSLDVQIFETNCLTDLVAVPSFVGICDFTRAEPSDLLEHYGYFLEVADRDFMLLLTHPPPVPPPAGLHRNMIRTPPKFHEKFLESLIIRRRNAVQRRMKAMRHYDRKLARLFYILRTIERQEFVSSRVLCNRFNVSPRTVARDMDLLMSMGEPIAYDPRRKGYCRP